MYDPIRLSKWLINSNRVPLSRAQHHSLPKYTVCIIIIAGLIILDIIERELHIIIINAPVSQLGASDQVVWTNGYPTR